MQKDQKIENQNYSKSIERIDKQNVLQSKFYIQKNNRMLRNSSKSSLGKKSLNEKYFTDHNKLLLLKIDTTLQQASNTLNHSEFYHMFTTIAVSLIRKYESENIDSMNLELFKKLLAKYNPNIQLSVRMILLQVKIQATLFPEENIALLNKAKHMVIDMQFEYLLSKVFILEAKIYQFLQEKDLQMKSLMKSIDFAQNIVLEHLNNREDIRKQITETIVVAYFQLYKLKRQENHKEAQEYLRRAYRTTQKNYGQDSQVTQLMTMIMNEHKNFGKGLQKMMSQSMKSSQQQKASTQIMLSQIKKDIRVHGLYLWEDEKITVQMIKTKNDEDVMVSYAEYNIKLDMIKINTLRNAQWVKVSHGEISILEDEILKALGIKQENTLTTKIGMKNISREEIIKKDSLSSSSQDPSFIQKEDFNFIRRLGRAQSAKKPPNNF